MSDPMRQQRPPARRPGRPMSDRELARHINRLRFRGVSTELLGVIMDSTGPSGIAPPVGPTPSHTLTVTRTGDGTLTYALTCDHPTEHCVSYEECRTCDSGFLDVLEYCGDDTPVQHGQMHRKVNFSGAVEWGVPTGRCWLREDPDWPEPARDLDLGPGTYRVVHTLDDNAEFYTLTVLTVIEPNRTAGP